MSDLVGNPEDRFSRVEAHYINNHNLEFNKIHPGGSFSKFLLFFYGRKRNDFCPTVGLILV